jgi:hypothetical protein
MPRPTKLAAQIAGALDLPAGRVQGWIEDGYGPAGDADPVEHYGRLAPLLGTGRNGDVAVLNMAADGYPCRRLRDVLTALANPGGNEALGADDLVEHLMGDATVADFRELWTDQARSAGVPDDLTAAAMPEAPLTPSERAGLGEDDPAAHLVERAATALDEPGHAELVVRTAALPIADLVAGNRVEMFDTAELNRMGGWEQLGMPAMAFDEEAAQLDIGTLALVHEAARQHETWIASASPDELARGVAASRVMLDALAVMLPGANGWGDEHRWRRIGFFAPMAQPLLAVAIACLDLAADVPVSPALKRYADALRAGRSLVPAVTIEQIPLGDRPD